MKKKLVFLFFIFLSISLTTAYGQGRSNDLTTDDIKILISERDALIQSLFVPFRSETGPNDKSRWACQGWWVSQGERYATEYELFRGPTSTRSERVVFDSINSTRLTTTPGSEPIYTIAQGHAGVGTYMPLNFGLLNTVERWSVAFNAPHRLTLIGTHEQDGRTGIELLFERLGNQLETIELIGLVFDPRTLLFIKKTTYISLSEIKLIGAEATDAKALLRVVGGKKYVPYVVNEILSTTEITGGVHIATKGRQVTPALPNRPSITTSIDQDRVVINDQRSDAYFLPVPLPTGTFVDDRVRKTTMTIVDPATGRSFADVRYEETVSHFRNLMGRHAAVFPEASHGFEGASCGLCCAYMISALFDRKATVENLSANIPLDEKNNGVTSFSTLKNILTKKGLHAASMAMSLSDFAASKEIAILQIKVEKLDQLHLIVAKMSADGTTINVASPPDGHARWTLDTLARVWTGKLIVVSDAPLRTATDPSPASLLNYRKILGILLAATALCLAALAWTRRRSRLGLELIVIFVVFLSCSGKDDISHVAITSAANGFGSHVYEVPGTTRPDQIIEHDFILKNTTKSTINISRVSKTCGCASVSISSSTVPPGQIIEVTTKVITSDLGGRFWGTVTLWSDINGRSTEVGKVSISALIVPKQYLSSSPRCVDLGQVGGTAALTTKIITITSSSSGSSNPLPVRLSHASKHILARKLRTGPRLVREMKSLVEEHWEISLRELPSQGPISGVVVFTAGSKSLRVPVTGRVVVPWISLEAYRVLLGRVDPGTTTTREIAVRESTSDIFVQSLADWVVARYDSDREFIHIQCHVPTTAHGLLRGVCRVRGDGDALEFDIPITALVR